MVIRELLIRLGLTGGESTGRDLDKVDNKVKSVTESFRGLGGVLTGVLAGISIKSVIDIADEMQSLEFRLGQMVTSTNGGAEAMDNLSKHASDARVSIESYAEAYTGIGAATHELINSEEDLLNVTDSVAMGLQLAGANTQQTTSVMMQLTQAIAVGKLQWADMRIIMQNSDAFASRLAKSLGMSLNEMVKATQGQGGGIGADKIVNALRNMSGEVRKEFASMPMTVHQALTIVGNHWDGFIRKINNSTHFINRIAESFLWVMDKVEYALNVMGEAVGGYANAIKLLGIAIAIAFAPGIIYRFGQALKWLVAVNPQVLAISAAIAAVAIALEDIYVWVKGGRSAIGLLLGPFDKLGENFKKTVAEMKKEFWGLFGTDSFEGLLNKFDAFLDSLTVSVKTWAKGLWASIYESLPGAAKVLIPDKWKPAEQPEATSQNTTSVDAPRKSPLTSLKDAGNAMAQAMNPPVTQADTLFSRGGAGYGQSPVYHSEYKPTISLTVQTNSDNPEEIKKAVSDALMDNYQSSKSDFTSDMLFNRGVSK